MGELDATLTQLNNTINNTISDTLPVLGLQEEKNLIQDNIPIQVILVYAAQRSNCREK